MCFNIELVEETAPMPSTWLPLSFRFIVNVAVLDQWCWWYGALEWWRVFLVGGGQSRARVMIYTSVLL